MSFGRLGALGTGFGSMGAGGGSAGPPIIANQSFDFGTLTKSSAGGVTPTVTGLATSWSITAGNASNHWQIGASTGAITPTATGDTANLNGGPYGLTVQATNSAGSASATITLNTVASSYSVITMTEATAAAADIGVGGGVSILCRSGSYDENTNFLKNRAYTSTVTVTAHSGAAPTFTLIDVNNSDYVVLDGLTFYRTAIDQMVWFRTGSISPTIQNCFLSGPFIDPEADWTIAQPTVVRSIVTDQTCTDVSILNNTISNVYWGIAASAVGTLRVEGNIVRDCYEDCYKFDYLSTQTAVLVKDNVAAGMISNSGDLGGGVGLGPHGDFMSFTGIGGATADWTGIVVERNIIINRYTRSGSQGIYAHGLQASAYYFAGMTIKGNVLVTWYFGGFVAGIRIQEAKDVEVIGNTIVVNGLSDPGSATVGITIGETTRSGTQIIRNNVADFITVTGSATQTNNVEGPTYSAAFDGPDFEVSSRADALSKFSMKAAGPLDLTTNVGAIGSGYVTWATTSPGNNGSLDASFAVTMALVSIGGLLRYPGITAANNVAASLNPDITLDAAGEYQCYVFQAREDMAITHVGWRCSTATGSPTGDIRIETVGTDGLPTGTLWATTTNKSGDTITTGWNLMALTSTATITRGQFFAVKIAYASGTSFVNQRTAGPKVALSAVPYQVVNTGTPTKGALTTSICLALGSSATTFYSLDNCFAVTTSTNSTFDNTNGARRGLRFQVPFECRMAGIAWYNSNVAGDFNVTLYSDAGSELSSSTTAIEGDCSALATTLHMVALFDNPVTLTENTWYRAVVEPTQSGTNVSVSFDTLPSSSYRSAWPFGSNAHYTTYASSAWDDTGTDKLPIMDILIDQLLART